MAAQNDTAYLLEQMERPAFCVCDEIITIANHAAQGRLIPTGQSVLPLLVTGQEEYASFDGGCLCLALEISTVRYNATVTKLSGVDLFVLDPPQSESELDVLALAARELREPLSRIMVVTGQIFPNLQTDAAPALAEQMARINRGLYQLLRITNNMTDAATFQSGRPHFEVLEFNSVLQEIFAHAQVLFESAGVSLEFLPHSQQIFTAIDQERLERAIYNLLSNALKYTPEGGRIQAKLTRRGSTAYLTILDNGSGIDLSSGGNVFTRYLREPSIEDPRNGIGLGLSMVRSVASIHGGTVLLESGESGAKVTLSLAIRQDATISSPKLTPSRSHDPGLVELADSLPHECYLPDQI